MAEIMELSLEELDLISGGRKSLIDTGSADSAVIRDAPGDGRILASLTNGTRVDTIGTLVYDAATKRNWVRVKFKNKNRLQTGWIAASIVGMR